MEQEKQIHTEVVDIDDLIQDDHNFNKGTEAGAELIGRSFKEHGAGRSVFIDKNNRLVGGNKAQKGFKGAGYRKVVIVDSDPDTLVAVRRKDVDLDTKEGREMAMLDNLTTQVNLAWDKAELESISDQVEGFDVGDFGFEIDDLPQVVMPTDKQGEGEGNPQTEVKEDDFDEKKEKIQQVCQKGDVWQLGTHRLMCGDSTDAEAFEKLMNGERADISFTSPPYNLMGGFNTHPDQADGYLGGENAYNEYSDDRSDEDYSQFLSDVLDNCLAHSDDTFFNIGYTKGALIGTALFLGRKAKNFCGAISWIKSGCYMPFFPIQHGMLGNITEPVYIFSKEAGRKLHHPTWKQGETSYNIVETKNAAGNDYSSEHSATFPVDFAGEFIRRFSHESVLDCFGGTGTTLIAAEQLGRKCYMMELDPHYCDIIIARWEKLTGQKAIKLNQ